MCTSMVRSPTTTSLPQTAERMASRVKTLIVTRANGEEDVVVEGFVPQGDLSRTFVLATNNFLLTGGDGYRALKGVNRPRRRRRRRKPPRGVARPPLKFC